MARQAANPDCLRAFPDGLFAIIMAILVFVPLADWLISRLRKVRVCH
jgi:hypothetical protein